MSFLARSKSACAVALSDEPLCARARGETAIAANAIAKTARAWLFAIIVHVTLSRRWSVARRRRVRGRLREQRVVRRGWVRGCNGGARQGRRPRGRTRETHRRRWPRRGRRVRGVILPWLRARRRRIGSGSHGIE